MGLGRGEITGWKLTNSLLPLPSNSKVGPDGNSSQSRWEGTSLPLPLYPTHFTFSAPSWAPPPSRSSPQICCGWKNGSPGSRAQAQPSPRGKRNLRGQSGWVAGGAGKLFSLPSLSTFSGKCQRPAGPGMSGWKELLHGEDFRAANLFISSAAPLGGTKACRLECRFLVVSHCAGPAASRPPACRDCLQQERDRLGSTCSVTSTLKPLLLPCSCRLCHSCCQGGQSPPSDPWGSGFR